MKLQPSEKSVKKKIQNLEGKNWKDNLFKGRGKEEHEIFHSQYVS